MSQDKHNTTNGNLEHSIRNLTKKKKTTELNNGYMLKSNRITMPRRYQKAYYKPDVSKYPRLLFPLLKVRVIKLGQSRMRPVG